MKTVNHFEALAQVIERSEVQLVEILTSLGNAKSALEEISCSVRALRGAGEELSRNNPLPRRLLAVYLPSNVLLYSYTLYCLIPNAYFDQVAARPASIAIHQTKAIHNLIMEAVPSLGEGVKISKIGQRTFARRFSDADAVVFTGQFENSLDVRARHPEAIFLFFGSGINPFFATESTDIDKAVSCSMESRLYNSGQDCLCPNIFFVHTSIADEYLEKLVTALGLITVGARKDLSADVCPIAYPGVVSNAADFLARHAGRIIYGRGVDPRLSVVHPTIVKSDVADFAEPLEVFSPVFNIVTYQNEKDVVELLRSDTYRDYRMGATVFGDKLLADELRRDHQVAFEDSLFSIDDGNAPFGGYGERSSYVRFGDQIESRPLLMSEEMARSGSSALTTAN